MLCNRGHQFVVQQSEVNKTIFNNLGLSQWQYDQNCNLQRELEVLKVMHHAIDKHKGEDLSEYKMIAGVYDILQSSLMRKIQQYSGIIEFTHTQKKWHLVPLSFATKTKLGLFINPEDVSEFFMDSFVYI